MPLSSFGDRGAIISPEARDRKFLARQDRELAN